ncbi:unnamed protein product [Closterium sp. NIES-53]
MRRDCYKIPDGWTPAQGQEGRGAVGGSGRGRGGRGSRGGGAANMKNGDNESESRDDRFPGQFFFVSTQAQATPKKDESFEEPAAVGKVTLHSLDYWQAEVKGMGKAMFKGADGKMVGLNNVLWVPNLAADLISVRQLQKAGMDTSSKGAKIYTARIGKQVLWDLDEDREVYNKMWQILVVPMTKERQVVESVNTKGEAVRSGYSANDGAKAKESNKCKPGGISKHCELEESGAAAKEQHKGEENPKAAAEEEYGVSMWGTIFIEGLMFKEWSERGKSKVTIPLRIEVGTNDPLLIPIELSSFSELTGVSHDLGGAEGEAADVEGFLQQGEAPVDQRGKRDVVRGGAKEGAAKERPKRAAHPRDFFNYERLGGPEALLVEKEEDEEEKGAEGEMEQIWHACDQGLSEGIDFEEVFSRVTKAPTLRVLLAAAAVCGWKVEKMDVKTAFLYGVVDEEIYMKQPEGYDDASGRVCRLNKAICGLKQASSCLYARLVEALEALGFKVSGCDESLFMTEGEEEKVFLLVYVDDILLFSPSLERIKEVQGNLKETFQCKALGPLGYYLGLHVERDKVKGWLRLHQHKYLAAMGEKYGLEERRSVKTPLPLGFQLHLDEEEGEVLDYELQRRFQSMVGSLMYASVNTRPDIAFSVSLLARVVCRPLQEHLDAVERLVSCRWGGGCGSVGEPGEGLGVAGVGVMGGPLALRPHSPPFAPPLLLLQQWEGEGEGEGEGM